MRTALIGSSGFVGGTLCRQHDFTATFRSHDVHELGKSTFDTIYCAGAPGQKWLANANPEADAENLGRLMQALDAARCPRVVLLSTVDVFAKADGVDERSETHSEGAGAYGRHRRALEVFVQKRFGEAHIVRLPGLVGRGLKKNALFDLRRGERLDLLRADAVFQFYPMKRLWQDLQTIEQHRLLVCHLTAAAIGLGEIAQKIFGVTLPVSCGDTAPHYDMRSLYAPFWGKENGYQVERQEAWAAIQRYARAEGEETSAEAQVQD